MNIIPAQEIKRRGIAAVDEAMAQGPKKIFAFRALKIPGWNYSELP